MISGLWVRNRLPQSPGQLEAPPPAGWAEPLLGPCWKSDTKALVLISLLLGCTFNLPAHSAVPCAVGPAPASVTAHPSMGLRSGFQACPLLLGLAVLGYPLLSWSSSECSLGPSSERGRLSGSFSREDCSGLWLGQGPASREVWSSCTWACYGFPCPGALETD